MFFEHFLGCFGFIFAQMLVCCSLDYGLSKKIFLIFLLDVGNMVKIWV